MANRPHAKADMTGSSFYNYVYRRLSKRQDCKIVVVGRNCDTGVGKTMCAISVCRLFHPDWTAYTFGIYENLADYFSRYQIAPPLSALLLDEVEGSADRRRSMAQENLDLALVWTKLRVNQVVSVVTLPDEMTLDKRLLKGAHVLMICLDGDQVGKANVYEIKIDDMSHQLRKIRFRDQYGNREKYTWENMDKDSDYIYMDTLKKNSNQKFLKKLTEKYGGSLAVDGKTLPPAVLRRMVATAGSPRKAIEYFNLENIGYSTIQRRIKEDTG